MMLARSGYPDTYYAATANATPAHAALEGDVSCDVCVVGAGYSGLSTALSLAEKGLKVVVLEADRIGFGASGRNGGQIINGYSRGYDTIRARYGEDTARALLNMSFDGGDLIRERVQKYNIACDLKPGSLFTAFTDGQMRHLQRNKEVWEMAGHDSLVMLDKAALRERVGTDIYCGGLLDPRGGHMHPLNLALGEARAIESLGGIIFENTRVQNIEKTAKSVAITDKGRVSANFIVICGNAYLGKTVPELTSRIMAVSSQILTTEVLGDDITRNMIPSDMSVEDCNFLLDYYRITADKRLLFGGGVVYSGAEPADIIRRLWPHVLRTFPQLKNRKVDFTWSGKFALTLTRMPHIGRLTDNVYFIQGDSGHGVTPCHLLGKLTAAAITGQAGGWDVFANMRNYPFPGGRMFRVPLTAMGAWYYGLREKLGI